MITIQALTARGNNARGDAVLDYLLATERLTAYYIGDAGMEQETVRWRGKGALALGLEGAPNREQMVRLARGFAPDGTALCRNAGAEPQLTLKRDRNGHLKLDAKGRPIEQWTGGHRVGFDLTCSAPKSVSVLMAMAEPEERGRIVAAHRQAVDAALTYIEGLIETRRGRGGREVLAVDGLVITSCDHLANRNIDPQLHTHNLIYGVALGADGQWATFDPIEMFQHQHAADAIYKAHLADGMRELGYGLAQRAELDLDGKDTGKRTWEVAGIDEATIQRFSTRDMEIRAAMAEGMSHFDAWCTTRKHKDEPSPDEMFSLWQGMLEQMPQSLDMNALKALGDTLAPVPADEDILRRLHEHEAIVEDKDLLVAVAQAHAGAGRAQLEEGVRRLKASMLEVAPAPIADADRSGQMARRHTRPRWSARWMVDWEQEVQRRADARRSETAVRVPLSLLESVIGDYQAEKGFMLSGEQRDAIRHLCCDSGGHAVLAGVAGAGKTTVADLYKRAFEAHGQRLLGACVSTRAAQKLEAESGIGSLSVAMLLKRLELGRIALDDKCVVVLDEAGMVHTEQVRQLMRYVDNAGAKLILQGDMKQLQPIGAGSGMALVSERLGQAELTEVRRQKRVEDRELAAMFYDQDAAGQIVLGQGGSPLSRAQAMAKSLRIWQRLEAEDKIDAWETRQQAMDALALDWFDSDYQIDSRLVLVHTHEDGQAIAQRLRAGLRDRGLLEGEEFKVPGRQGERPLELTLARGDRLRITENAAALGLTNGDLAEIVRIRANEGGHDLRLRIQARGDRESFMVDISTQDFNHFNQGYADTIHKSQGQGQPAVFHFVNPQQTNNQTMLVAFTRMTHHYRLYGAEADLDLVRMKLGMDRTKQNAVQRGVAHEQEMRLT
jgi:conjugative relaxase-like TrwC/TraI family protein